MNALEVIDRFAGLKVAVIGDAVLDVYVAGSSGRICREAPVPVVKVDGRHANPGGSANTARNIATLGATVDFISVVGSDTAGDELIRILSRSGVNVARTDRQA